MPGKFTTITHVVYKVLAKGKIRFSDEFVKNIKLAVKDLSIIVDHWDTNDQAVVMTIRLPVGPDTIFERLTQLELRITMLAEHGKNADLLDQVLARFPTLKDHPNISRVIENFERFMTMVETTAGDESLPVVLERQRRDVEKDHPGPEQLEVAERAKPTEMSKADHREACLRGQEANQPVEDKAVPADAQVPEVYKRLMGKGGATSAADKGNVFGG